MHESTGVVIEREEALRLVNEVGGDYEWAFRRYLFSFVLDTASTNADVCDLSANSPAVGHGLKRRRSNGEKKVSWGPDALNDAGEETQGRFSRGKEREE